MKITFLGTSAGESYPAIWCDCPNCTYARQHGGRNLRMNTGSLLDDDVLLDLNSCTFYTAARLGISLSGVTTLLATHPHGDHITVEPLAWRRGQAPENLRLSAQEAARKGIGGPTFTALPLMTIYGNACVREKYQSVQGFFDDGRYRLAFQQIGFGTRYQAGTLSFIPVRAMHGPQEGFANSYILERGGKRLLYALDTGGYDAESTALLESYRYDAVVMEGTFGHSQIDGFCGHQTKDKNIAFRRRMIGKGCIADTTPFYLTHLCPHWTPPYDLYAPEMAAEGFTVAYDGMVAEI